MTRRDRSGVQRARQHTGDPLAGGLPAGFVEAAQSWLGAEAPAFLTALTKRPALAIRPNPAKLGPDGLDAVLGPEWQSWPSVPWWAGAFLPPAPQGARLAAHHLTRVGALYAQDPAALAAVALLDPQPGERVLDLCAAPGGKSTAILDRMDGRGLLVGNDMDARRARELERTLDRWGSLNHVVMSRGAEEMAGLLPGHFDRVLVDAPCSGEAMFARRGGAARDWSPRHVRGCAPRQRALLAAARRLVRPGGLLVYATCTFNPIENEGVIAAYLTERPGDALLDAAERLPGAAPGRPDLLDTMDSSTRPDTPDAARPSSDRDTMRCARLWPHLGPGAGHFVAAIRVDDAPPEIAVQTGEDARAARQDGQEAAVRAVLDGVAPGWSHGGAVILRGERAYAAPIDVDQAIVHASLAPGLRVAERRGATWRPAHALALALRPDQARGSYALDDTELAALYAGQPIRGAGEGIILAAWQGLGIGWLRGRGGWLAPLWPLL